MKTISHKHRPDPTPEQQASLDLYAKAMAQEGEGAVTMRVGDEPNGEALFGPVGGKSAYATTHEKTVAAFGGESTLHYKTANSEPRTRAWYWTRAQASHKIATNSRREALKLWRSAPRAAIFLLGCAFSYRMQAYRFKFVGLFLPKRL